MALATPSVLTSGSNDSDLDSYDTASVSPTPSKTVFVVVGNSDSAGPETPTVSGCGITFTEEQSVPFADNATPTRRLTVFSGSDAAAVPGAITIDFATQQGSCHWIVFQTDGDDTVAPVVQTAENFLDVTDDLLTVTLAAFASSSNGVLAFVYKNSTQVLTPEVGYTELAQTSGAAPNTSVHAVFRDNPDTQVDLAWTSNMKAGAIALELKSAAELTATQKATYVAEIERIIGRVRQVTGRLTARRAAGADVTEDLARIRAIQADLKSKWDEMLTDSTDIDAVLTVIEADVDILLTQIGTIGNPAPTPVPLVKGLMKREAPSTNVSIPAYNPEISWASLQANEGGPIGGAGKTELDALIADQGDQPFRMRLFCGYLAPQWLKDILGTVTIYYAQTPSDPPETCVRFWDSRIVAYYADLHEKLAALYDGQLSLIFESGVMTVYAEPFMIQAGDSRNRTNLLAAGYTPTEHAQTFEDCIRATQAWTETRIGLACNTLQTVNLDGSQGSDQAKTGQLMELHRQLFGERSVLQANNLKGTSGHTSYVYNKMRELGAPISMQTATAARVEDLADACEFGISIGLHGIELPGASYPGLLTQAQLDDFNARLQANP